MDETKGMASLGRVKATQRLNLAIGLPLRDPQGLDDFLGQLHNPASPLFHQYLTTEQFTERFCPSLADYQAVVEFARTNGFKVTATHANRLVLSVNASVGEIEKAFHVNLHLYQHPKENRKFYAPDTDPTVDLDVKLLSVAGLNDLSLPHPAGMHPMSESPNPSATPRSGSGSGGSYIGKDFRAAYVPGLTNLIGSGQKVGLLQFDGYYSVDIANYASAAGLTNIPLLNVAVDGGVGTPGSGNGEVCLDIEMAMAMAPGLSQIIVYMAPNPSPWADLLSRMANDNLAKQLSCSWGGGSPDATSEQLFKQMAAQGQSFFNATGDSDAFTTTIEFPSDSTNITEVGGTTLSTTGPGGTYVSETVWNWGGGTGSSGGISTRYPIPSFQQGISMAANGGSSTMRNVPDVALTGDNVYVKYNNGGSGTFGGTSCAAPLWAGFMALVNQQAAAAGKPYAGFINPAVYNISKSANYATAFHDVTTGDNTSTSSPGKFYATAGYDLCTGLGTPTGAGLINLLAPIANIPQLSASGYTLLAEGCAPANGVVDPGETVTVNFALKNIGGLNTTNLVATLLTNASVQQPSGPNTYGVVVAGGSAVNEAYTFTANATCGGSVTATLQLQDGATNLGTASFTIPVGQLVTSTTLQQNFDGVAVPALPAGWATNASGGQTAWVTTTAASDTSPNSAFAPDPASVGVSELMSPVVPVVSTSAKLTFRHNYNLEYANSSVGYDGGVLEISIGGGAFADIITAGGSFVTGGYDHTISSSYGSAIGGRQAWSGISSGFITSTVTLPASAAGQNVQFKWRCASDNSVSKPGWYVDSVSLTDGFYVCCTTPSLLMPAFSSQPSNVVVALGGSTNFLASANGTPSPTYQWRFNGANLSTATASVLALSNIQLTQAGNYAVVISNAAGALTSSPATLRVLASPTVASMKKANGVLSFPFSSVTGLTYTLEYKTTLTGAVWTALPNAVIGSGGTILLQDTNKPIGTRFYRVRVN